MRGWGAEEIFRPIAFAWLEWIRRLGPYVILEEHGPGIYNIHINTIKRLGPYVILDEHGPGIYHFLPAIGRHFCQRQASEAFESFSGFCYIFQK